MSSPFRIRSIQTKIVLWTGVCMLLLASTILGVAAVSVRGAAIEAATEDTLSVAGSEATRVKAELERALVTARTMAQTFSTVRDPEQPTQLTRDQVNAMLLQVLEDNPQFLGTYTLWEPNAFDGLDAQYANSDIHDATGRFIPYWVRNLKNEIIGVALVDYETPGLGDWYLLPRQTKAEQVFSPFFYPIEDQQILLSSFVVPIVVGDQFYGIAGVDLRVDFLQELTDQLNLYDGTGQMVLISSAGTIAGMTGHPELINEPASSVYTHFDELWPRLQAGETFVQSRPEENLLQVFVPIYLGETATPWSVGVIVPFTKVTAGATLLTWRLIGVSASLTVLALMLLWVAGRQISRPIRDITIATTKIAQGDLNSQVKVASTDEIGTLAETFNKMATQLRGLIGDLERRVEERTQDLTQAQARTEGLLAEVADASRIAALASFELDVNTQTLVFSDLFYELLGTTAEAEGGYRKPMAEAVQRFVHPDEAQRVLPEVQELVAARDASVRQLEYRLVRRDGATRSFAFRFDVTRDAEGAAIQVRGAAQDITERKRFEADLARRANELTILSESARTVSSTLEVQEVINRLLQQLPRLMDFDTALIQLINQRGERQQIGGVSLDVNRQTTLLAPADYFLRPVADDPLITAVVRGRVPLVISQTHTDPRWEVLPETQHIRSWLAAPLLVGQEVIGLLMMGHTQPGAYTAETTPLINAFTAQAAIALQNARVFDESQKRAAELETVTQFATAITTIQNPQEMLQTVVDLVKPSFNLYHAHIYLLDEAGDQLTLTAGAGVVGYQMASEKRGIPLNREHSLVARAARTRQAVIANDVSKEPDFLSNPLLPNTKSELAVPLTLGAQLLGVLDVQADQVDHFTASDARIQTVLAAQIATALQNARSFARSEQTLKDLDALNRRLTREGWEGYLDQVTAGRLGYQYDGGELSSLNDGQPTVTEAEPGLVRPVVSHGETIGRLAAEGAENADADTQLILEAVAQGLSTHIDNLRLTEQTQKALAEQVRLAAEMDNQRTTLETVLLNIPAGVWVAEAPSGKHILSNPRAQAMLGRGAAPAAEAGTEPLAEEYPVYRADSEEIYPTAELPLVRGMFGETARVDDMEIRWPNGDRAWLEVVGAPIRDARGRITASVAIFQDISERRQAEAEIRRRNDELAALNRVGSVLTSSFSLRTILQAAAQEIVRILRVRSTGITLLTSDHENLTVVADYSADPDAPSAVGVIIPLAGNASTQHVLETKRPVVIEDAQTDPLTFSIHDLMRERQTRGLIIVPLVARGEVIGTIGVDSSERGRKFTADEVVLVETMAGQLASAAENIRLFDEAQRRARELEAVAEVGTAASTLLDTQTLLQTVVDLTKSRFALYHAHVYMMNDAGQALTLAAGAGRAGQAMVAEGRRIPLGAEQSLVARAARTRQGVVVNDVRAEPGFLPHPLLPETRSELAVPLIAGDKVLGVFDVQSQFPSRFTEEDVRIQTTLATQVAVALQNAATFTQVVEARSQIEAQARRLTREGWADFLNAIDHRERLGYIYDQTRLRTLAEAGSDAMPTNGHGLSLPLVVTGEPVGTMHLEGDGDWSNEAKIVATLVVQRLSQQVENLRLIDQAQRYRAEAENAIRRLTREGWQNYELANPAFLYDQDQVTPLLEADNGHPSATLVQPITVRGEPVGQVGVTGLDTPSPEQAALVTLVAQRLSSHIENLRLFDQTQSALSTTQSLYQISSRIALADDLQEVLAAVGEGLPVPGINRLLLFIHELDAQGELDAAVIAANWYSGEGTPPTPVGQRYPRAVFNSFRLMLSPTPLFFGDVQKDDRSDPNTRAVATQLNIRAVAALPLRAGARQVGTLLLEGEAPHDFRDSEIQPYLSVAETVAIALENRRLAQATQAALAETEDQAHRLTLLNEMGEQLNRATTRDELFTVAVTKTREIVGAQWSSLYMLTEAHTHFEVINIFNDTLMRAPVAENTTETRFNLVGSTLEDILRDPRMVVTPDTRSSAMFDLRGLAGRGLLAALQAPLLAGGRVIGTLNANSAKVNAFGPREVNLMQQVVALVSTTLENRRLLEQTQKRAAELETVAKVSATASAILDSEQLLQMVVDLTKGSFGLYHTHAYLLDDAGETLVLTAGAGLIGSQMVAEGRRIPLAWEQSLVARAARTRQAVMANDVRADPDFLPHRLLPDTRAELAVPMIVGDTVVGVFDVQANIVNYFTDEDVRIQNTLAAQIAVALNNANLYADQSATVARLRELDHLKSSFLANMSHELRTPLNSILGFTEVILEELDGPLTEQMEGDLRIVYKNGQHLLHLINDVLDMAKIESGKLTLHPEPVDLAEILEEVIGLTSPLANTKDIELRLEADAYGGTLEAEVDRIRIRQVMINIINNAIKFTDQGHIAIRAVAQDDFIRITVKDTGLGVPTGHLESIFQEFTQVDTTTTRKAGGTGLGLPISRHLVQMHGGKLWAESTGIAGEGSTFIVELPVKAAYEAPAED